MTSNKEIRIEAKTIEAAVVMACVKLGVTQDNIEYEVLKQPKSGLMSIFGGKAEIKAWARSNGQRQGAHRGEHRGERHDRNGQDRGNDKRHKNNHRRDRDGARDNEKREARSGREENNDNRNRRNDRFSKDGRKERNNQPRAERQPREERAPAEPLTQETLAALEVEIRGFCSELCEKIVGNSVAVSSKMTEERLQLEVDDSTIAQMIQENSKFVESLEHLLRKKPRHLKQDLPFRIFVDAQGSRKGREDEIARSAKEKADQVASTGQKVVLDYKSAADRKIVHMTLENDERVYTKSIGTGSGRKLLILPSRGRKPERTNDEESGDEE